MEEYEQCYACGSSDIEYIEGGTFRGIKWNKWKCNECGEEYSTEPDYDAMSSGHDDY